MEAGFFRQFIDGLPFPLFLLFLLLFVADIIYTIPSAYEGSIAAIVFGFSFLFLLIFMAEIIKANFQVDEMVLVCALIFAAITIGSFIKSLHDVWLD